MLPFGCATYPKEGMKGVGCEMHWRMSGPHDTDGGEGDTADWNAGGDRRDSHITIPARPATTTHHVGTAAAPRKSRLRRPEKKHLTDLRGSHRTEQGLPALAAQWDYDLRMS